ncbi:hypothetical protein B4U79_18449 [Dinothrombium tinctorium]|uniref:RING-type domain-containing protein n=1 Tax=Dinothrombium tinctorium TaxID=1965070 RepID=A0A3S3P1M5_9ACAR|nr:hypothetical protein B4U79_18449 [Dinothrombium tinctorium]
MASLTLLTKDPNLGDKMQRYFDYLSSTSCCCCGVVLIAEDIQYFANCLHMLCADCALETPSVIGMFCAICKFKISTIELNPIQETEIRRILRLNIASEKSRREAEMPENVIQAIADLKSSLPQPLNPTEIIGSQFQEWLFATETRFRNYKFGSRMDLINCILDPKFVEIAFWLVEGINLPALHLQFIKDFLAAIPSTIPQRQETKLNQLMIKLLTSKEFNLRATKVDISFHTLPTFNPPSQYSNGNFQYLPVFDKILKPENCKHKATSNKQINEELRNLQISPLLPSITPRPQKYLKTTASQTEIGEQTFYQKKFIVHLKNPHYIYLYDLETFYEFERLSERLKAKASDQRKIDCDRLEASKIYILQDIFDHVFYRAILLNSYTRNGEKAYLFDIRDLHKSIEIKHQPSIYEYYQKDFEDFSFPLKTEIVRISKCHPRRGKFFLEIENAKMRKAIKFWWKDKEHFLIDYCGEDKFGIKYANIKTIYGKDLLDLFSDLHLVNRKNFEMEKIDYCLDWNRGTKDYTNCKSKDDEFHCRTRHMCWECDSTEHTARRCSLVNRRLDEDLAPEDEAIIRKTLEFRARPRVDTFPPH